MSDVKDDDMEHGITPELQQLMDEVNAKPEQAELIDGAESSDSPQIAALKEELAEVKELLAKLSDVRAKDNTDQTAQFNSALSASIKEILSQVIPAAGIGISQAQQEANKKQLAQQIRERQAKLIRCSICRQPISACGGPYALDKDGNPTGEKDQYGNVKPQPNLNHIMAYVGPKNYRLFKWFQGITVGGIRYLSDRPGHAIPIPKKSDILALVNIWENDQEDLLQGRKAEGNGPMGFVGPGQTINKMDNQQYLGWR